MCEEGEPASLPHQLWCSALLLPTGNDKHRSQPRTAGTLAAEPTATQSPVCVRVPVCKESNYSNLWLMWAIVSSPCACQLPHWAKWSHIILRKPPYHEPWLLTGGRLSQLEQMIPNVTDLPGTCQLRVLLRIGKWCHLASSHFFVARTVYIGLGGKKGADAGGIC